MNRRDFLTMLGVGSESLLPLPALAKTGGSDQSNWQPDGLVPLKLDSDIFWQNIFDRSGQALCLCGGGRHFQMVQLSSF